MEKQEILDYYFENFNLFIKELHRDLSNSLNVIKNNIFVNLYDKFNKYSI